MMETRELELEGKKVNGFKVDLPKAPLIVIIAPKGYIMCGYLNLGTAEKLGQVAAIVRGVKDFNDVLNAKISAATTHAMKLGVEEGMLGRDALKKMV